MSEATVAELFFVGNHDVMANDIPNKFKPYMKHIKKIKIIFDCLKTCTESVMTSRSDISPTKKLKKIAHAA
jgi:hypothetical protein